MIHDFVVFSFRAAIDGYDKDGGEELSSKMHGVQMTNL